MNFLWESFWSFQESFILERLRVNNSVPCYIYSTACKLINFTWDFNKPVPILEFNIEIYILRIYLTNTHDNKIYSCTNR